MITAEDLEAHRSSLTGHCYRMLGSAVDADDAVQEAMLRAWRGLERFDGRSSLRTWLYRIATNVCLDAIAARARRERPVDAGPSGTVEDELVQRPRSHWLEPIPDARALPSAADPAQLAAQRQSLRLAFVAALQHLPAKQRAALLLAEVVGWSAAEIADCLDTSVAAVNSALQRARATLAAREVKPVASELTAAQSQTVARFVEAFERYDMEALAAILREDAVMSMPPFTLWLRGHEAISAWMLGRGAACRGSRLVPTAANGQVAFGQYKPAEEGDALLPWALVVLELDGNDVGAMTFFLDTEELFPRFDLPPELGR
jgi:RNA polymerase sigma-70 factor, ECF subfamily